MKYFLLSLALTSMLVAQEMVVDQLTSAQLQEIYQRLQSSTLLAPKLTDDELNRAAIHGLLARLGTGFTIGPVAPTAPQKLVSELLSPNVAYLRPATFNLAELPTADAALETLARSTASTLILDLRSPAPPGDPEAAAAWLSRFMPTQTPLFTVRTSGSPTPQAWLAKGEPRWTKDCLLLVDQDTGNIAEALAAVLQRDRHPRLIGSPTLGHAIRYAVQALTPTLEMRWGLAELWLDGQHSLFRHGLTPDLAVAFDPATKARQFKASETTGMKPLAFDQERPHRNEAARVAHQDPTLDYRIAPAEAPPMRDPVLQQALDYLTAQPLRK